MCVVSMVMDHYLDKWKLTPPVFPLPSPTPSPFYVPAPAVTPGEVEELRRLLDRAREYDRRHSQPDCELEEKRQALRKLAELLGVAIDFV
jgi:hypothetical protein